MYKNTRENFYDRMKHTVESIEKKKTETYYQHTAELLDEARRYGLFEGATEPEQEVLVKLVAYALSRPADVCPHAKWPREEGHGE